MEVCGSFCWLVGVVRITRSGGGVDEVKYVLTMESELSLTVPIVNTTAFLFTVVGEWWVEGKVISRGEYLPLLSSFPRREKYVLTGTSTETMLGMFLCLGGIALCVQSKQNV